jgi:ubiquinone/menaquinone biosynthesis C-methylase UbiE
MNTVFEEIKKQQKEVWNRFSPGWRKWDALTMNFCQPVTDEMIGMLRLKDTDKVLDVAGGTGEPGLTIARIVKNGKVIAVDQSEGMLSVAREKEEGRGVKNYEIQIGEVSQLPFPDNTFDAISSRFGLMFFPDIPGAVKEMTRVLKRGGRMAVAVWDGPEKNFWVTGIMGIIMKHLDVSPPAPDAPGMFRCAQEGSVAGMFRGTGLKNVTEKQIPLKLACENADTYWNYMTDVGAAIVAALSKADTIMREKIQAEVTELLSQKYGDGQIAIDAAAIVIVGEK